MGYAYFSLKDLPTWFEDLLLRIKQLDEYSEELIVPKSLWISGLFNPMSFLTAIMQVTARRDGLPLDDMTLKTDVINIRDPNEIQESPRMVNTSTDSTCRVPPGRWEGALSKETSLKWFPRSYNLRCQSC